MKISILLLWVLLPAISQEIEMKLEVPAFAEPILLPHQNGNFHQGITVAEDRIQISIWSQDYFRMGLVDRLAVDYAYINSLQTDLRAVCEPIVQRSLYLNDFMKSLSNYLKTTIAYSEVDQDQDAIAVIKRGDGDCIGYCNVAQVFLRSAGIPCRIARGFFLKIDDTELQTVEMIPHRWLEINMANRFVFFYDPQYQSFSGMYLLTREDIDFTKISRFSGRLISKRRKIG